MGLGIKNEIAAPTERAIDKTSHLLDVAAPPTCEQLIMAVEDDEATRATISIVLQATGYPVVEASNAQDALDRLRAGCRPDLILLGWHMGGGKLDGDAFLAAQKQDPQLASIPVVACSGNIDRQAAFDLGVKAIIQKPFGVYQLLFLVYTHALRHPSRV